MIKSLIVNNIGISIKYDSGLVIMFWVILSQKIENEDFC